MSASPPSPRKHSTRDESQWALVWREFRKRKLAVVSMYVILLLITVSVFAPFLANSKPLYYRGINRFAFEESIRTITTLAQKISRLPDDPTAEQLEFVRNDAAALRDNVDLLAGLMAGETLAEFQAFSEELLSATDRAVDNPDARASLGELRIRLRTEFRSKSAELVPTVHWPVFASLTWPEIWFIVFNVLLILFPLVKWCSRRLAPRGSAQLLWGTMLGLPSLSAFGWWMSVPERIDRTDYRSGVMVDSEKADSAPVVYEAVKWPWVPYALDESNLYKVKEKPAISGLFAPLVPPEQSRGSELPPWSKPHVMGTDETGRDIFCRMLWGGRVSLSVGIVAVLIYVSIGIVVGAIAGYFRGTTDMLISRIIEVVICFPSFFLILTIVAFLGPGIFKIMIVIGLTSWTGVARLVRGEFLRLADQEFVLAGRALGYSPWRLIFKHVLPNAMAPVLVAATFGVAGAILTESALSFLNLGISVPTPSWGGIMASGHHAIHSAPWLIYFPGVAIFLTITAYNLVGEAFRDASDPRLRGRR